MTGSGPAPGIDVSVGSAARGDVVCPDVIPASGGEREEYPDVPTMGAGAGITTGRYLFSSGTHWHQASETLGRASVLGEGIGHGPSVVRGLPAHVGYNPTCLSRISCVVLSTLFSKSTSW